MQLQLIDKQQLLTRDFGNWLIPHIRIELLSQFRNYNFKAWNNFLTKSSVLNRLYTRDYTVFEVLMFASNNLVCIGRDGNVIIKFDDNKFVPGFDRVKLSTLLKTINYGTIAVKGVPIITNTFNYFVDTITQYVEDYYGI